MIFPIIGGFSWCNSQVLKRAASVPSRVALDAAGKLADINQATQSQPLSVDITLSAPQTGGLSTSTTDENIKCSTSAPSTEPPLLLRQSNTTPDIQRSGGGGQLLPHLPNITPVRAPTYQGWL